MEIPFDWYAHIIPGIIILSSIFIFAYNFIERKLRSEILELVKKNNILSIIIILIMAYIIGLSLNKFILCFELHYNNCVRADSLRVEKPSLNKGNIIDSTKVEFKPSPKQAFILTQYGTADLINSIYGTYIRILLLRSSIPAIGILGIAIIYQILYNRKK